MANEVNNTHTAVSASVMEKAYGLLMKSPSIVALVKGRDNRIELANERILSLWNKTSEIIGQPLLVAIPELEGQGMVELLDYVRKTGQTYYANQVPATTFSGGRKEVRYFDLVYQPYFDEGCNEPTGVFTLSHDVTELVLARQKAEKSELRLQKVFSIETVGIIYFDLKGTLHDVNKAFERMSGYSRDEVVNGRVRWDQLTPPEFMEATLKSREEFITEGQNTPYEKQYFKPDGSRWWGLFAGKRLSDDECVEFVLDISLIKQVEEELEKRVEQRTGELQLLNVELQRSNQNLEQFANAVSHDLKEPIRKIQLFEERLMGSVIERLTDAEKSFLRRIESAAIRMNKLIEDLLSYSQLNVASRSFQEIDLNELIEQIIEDIDFKIEEKHATVHVDALCSVYGDRSQLQQAFQNLISNSLKYGKPGIAPQISIRCRQINGEEMRLKTNRVDIQCDYNVIEIEDNGIGFEQKDAERIFNVFTRLHGNEFRGTGVGLSIVRRVIENHNGFVTAEGNPGVGSAFQLYLPIDHANH